MSSHDVVNACRRIFGERRVGHTGTLDPLATGALAVCIGPATRLDAFMVGHDKVYEVRISFGASTDTDDAQGSVVRTAPVPESVCDPQAARAYLASLIGRHKQMPPAYSAIKRGGVKAYEAARSGNVIELEPRDIEVYAAELLALETDPAAPCIFWDVRFAVSKGTYIRSLARDAGLAFSTVAHVEALRRVQAGQLHVEDCVTLEALESRKLDAVVDPVFLLGYRMAFLSDEQAADVGNGKAIAADSLRLFEAPRRFDDADCGPRRAACASTSPLSDEECVSLVHGNALVALYTMHQASGQLRARCVFSQGVIRGKGL